MKKLILLAVAIVIGIGTLSANPVDLNTAKSLGQQFVMANFEQNHNTNLNLVYTVISDNGEPCVYVFSVGDAGFVLVSASDNVRPILGYSERDTFDASNPYHGMMYMLDTYKNSISYAIRENIAATPEIAEEWTSLRKTGKLNNKRAKKVGPLVQTIWNQDTPYNLYSPQVPAGVTGSGGRCYAGCVATAVGQLMKYWDHPITGTGSHSYHAIGYGPTYYDYGMQSADFGATTYQWDLMPLELKSNSPQEQKEAVATLLYHIGVAVEMKFDYDGSGSNAERVVAAMPAYFDYNNVSLKARSSYSLANWIQMLKDEFDLGRPVYYSGMKNANDGHAFVCDGYDQNDMMHFNWGWGGSNDNFFVVDAIDYSSSAQVISNFVPTSVYQNTIKAPTNVTATRTSDMAQEATISWKNPTKTMGNQTVTSLDQVVVTRDGLIIYTADNPTPGADMTFVDSNVPGYTAYEYGVYMVKNGVNGVAGKATETFGPTCNWTIQATTTSMTGWKSAYIVAYDGADHEVDRFTMTSNNATNYNMGLVPGKVSFAWVKGTTNVSLTFKIKDPSGNIVYEYSGTSNNVPVGTLYEGSFGCSGSAPTAALPEIFATSEDGEVVLTWEGEMPDNVYGLNVYRDGVLCGLAHGNMFVDQYGELGGHCYQVCYLSEGGESELSNEVCATAGFGCDAGSNLDYEIWTGNAGIKPTLTWDAPENAEGLTKYYIYRKTGEDGSYSRISTVNANKTSYKENKTLEDGVYYYYKVMAYYGDTECISSPFKAREGNDYFVVFQFNDFEGVSESTVEANLYPNPAKDSFTVEAEKIQSVVVYNTIGQEVYRQVCEGNSTVIELSHVNAGIYMVKIVTANGESVQKLSVVK